MSGRLIVVAPASTAARQTVATNAGSDRVASSHENSTSSTFAHACVTEDVAAATTSSGRMRSFFSMCSALVARKMWIRERGASSSAAAAASMSVGLVRQSEAIVARSAARATSWTPSKSPGEEAAKPASITSTPSRSSCSPTSTFSSGRKAMPGACSPSRSVVSKMVILRELNCSSLTGPAGGPVASDGGRLRLRGAWSLLPLEGENQEDETDRPGRGCYEGPSRACGPGYGRHHGLSLVAALYFVKWL